MISWWWIFIPEEPLFFFGCFFLTFQTRISITDPSLFNNYRIHSNMIRSIMGRRPCRVGLYVTLLSWVAALMMRLLEGKLSRLSVSLFIKTEGGGSKLSERNWWVKHPTPEELNLLLRAKIVNFNCTLKNVSLPCSEHTCFPLFPVVWFASKSMMADFNSELFWGFGHWDCSVN